MDIAQKLKIKGLIGNDEKSTSKVVEEDFIRNENVYPNQIRNFAKNEIIGQEIIKCYYHWFWKKEFSMFYNSYIFYYWPLQLGQDFINIITFSIHRTKDHWFRNKESALLFSASWHSELDKYLYLKS